MLLCQASQVVQQSDMRIQAHWKAVMVKRPVSRAVQDLAIVEQGLIHDLVKGQGLRGQGPVRLEVVEGTDVGARALG
jgi:hypothetical protein